MYFFFKTSLSSCESLAPYGGFPITISNPGLSKLFALYCFILFDYIYLFNQINLYNDLWIYSGKFR